MDDHNEQLRCKIDELETYIDKLETKLYDRDDAHNDVLSKLDLMKCNITDTLTDLVNKNEQLILKYNEEHTLFLCCQEENDCLRCKNEDLFNQVKDQEAALEDLESTKLANLIDIKTLKKQLSDAISTTKKFHDGQRQAESELKIKDQDIICLQNTLADKITRIAELEKNLSTEQDRYECLQSSICELKIKNENIVCALKAEMTGVRGELNEKIAKLVATKQKLKDARDEVTKRKIQTIKLKKTITENHEASVKEKNKMDERVVELKAEIESLVSEVACINTKLCNSQTENNKLICQLADQNESIKLLEATKIKLQKEIERINETTEFTEKMIMTEREQHGREQQISKKKLEFKAQEECELKQLNKKLTEQIIHLKKKQYDKKTCPH